MYKILEKIKVLVTRPDKQADNLCRLIEDLGGTAIRFPVIEISKIEDLQVVNKLLNNIETYDIGIFISKNAVEWTLSLLGDKTSALENLKLISIGSATTAALKRALSNNVITNSGTNSETLLEDETLSADAVSGKKIIIFRGQGGRELLATILRQRGAKVELAEVYRRDCPQYEHDFIDRIWTLNNPDIVVVTSNNGLENLFSLMNDEQKKLLLSKQLVVMGRRMLDFSAAFGFAKTPIFTEESDDEGILKLIIKWAG
ncbi:MAG: uroporphyrinogen-III synthase [Gammaproteobacteria bacterium]|jgi:uroporphyrinogen-III synthase